MKAVVHIGVSKAGSTTIQRNTFAHRDALIQSGILVPTREERFIRPIDFAEEVLGRGQTDQIRSAIEADIAKHKPRFVFLSSEYLYYQKGAPEALEVFVAPWADEIEVVLLVREPAGRYVSACQQRLRGQYRLVSPAEWRSNYRSLVESWRRQFGSQLTVLPFQRSAFPQGLVNSLFYRFFPDVFDSLPNLDDQVANPSDSSEVTRLLEMYFGFFYPEATRKSRYDVTLLRNHLKQTALDIGLGAKPTLRPEVRELVMRNHSEDLAWLAAEEGIVFDGVGAAFTGAEPHRRPSLDTVSWSDIVFVDNQEVKKLALYAASRAAAQLATWPFRKLGVSWRRLLGSAS
ncbi:MAG: hypothetical protein QNJ62_03515 [Methyloceanibacter sp.]|nr:hypothetical protein [Methyloceanibacter sp.]